MFGQTEVNIQKESFSQNSKGDWLKSGKFIVFGFVYAFARIL